MSEIRCQRSDFRDRDQRPLGLVWADGVDGLNLELDNSMMRFFGKKDTQERGGEAEATPKAGLLDRMRQAVERTRESLGSRIEGIVALTRTVDEGTLEELETALLTSDLGVQTTTAILDGLRDRAKRKAIEGGAELRALLKDELKGMLERPIADHPAAEKPVDRPLVIFLVGVNGTGKTTSAGKLAAW